MPEPLYCQQQHVRVLYVIYSIYISAKGIFAGQQSKTLFFFIYTRPCIEIYIFIHVAALFFFSLLPSDFIFVSREESKKKMEIKRKILILFIKIYEKK